MAMAPSLPTSSDPSVSDGEGTHTDAPELRLFVMALFFIFGGITSLNDVIIPKLKELFTLVHQPFIFRMNSVISCRRTPSNDFRMLDSSHRQPLKSAGSNLCNCS